MKEADKDWMIRMMGGWMFLLVPDHLGTPGHRAVKRLLLLLCCLSVSNFVQKLMKGFAWNFQGRLAMGPWTND